ncbi:MAG: CRISPR system precrRNA processing endoribonuclease RAMP protein Cas6 [Pseudomonadota bacterium]
MQHWLDHPVEEMDYRKAVRRLSWWEITIAADLPRDFEDVPNLADRLRGALGRALHRQAARPETGWLARVPTPYEMLFGEAFTCAGKVVPRPFVIAAECGKGKLTAKLRLAGIAGSSVEPVCEALQEALERGIAIRHGGRLRVALTAQSATMAFHRGFSLPATGNHLSIRLLTPLVVRHGSRASGSLASLPHSMFRRLQGLARWDGFSVKEPEINFKDHLNCLDTTLEGFSASNERRHSSEHGSNGMPVRGFTGIWRIAGNIEPLAPLFAAAAAFHAGGETALGFGRMEVLRY